jgi:hypothetical protein
MESLQAFFTDSGSSDIHKIAQYIQQHVDEQWETVYQNTRDEMVARYAEIGDSVYGIYGSHLFRHIHHQLKEVGLRATPRLPGDFNSSREWGEETDRQRWMWSKIVTKDNAPVGTILVAFYHDHEQIRIPRAFKIIGLEVTGKQEVVDALSKLSPDFRQAREAKIEIAEYLAQLEQSQSTTQS